MRLEGKTLDGKDLDWAKYRGKVVLIDFWATWCGPCRAEIPNIKDNYEKYQRQGFEVIGISLDQMSSRELAEFVKKEEVPWTICRDADSPQSMAAYYGIRGIPQMILVGRDGKVITLECPRSALGPLVEKALAAAGNMARVADDEDRGEAQERKGAEEGRGAGRPEGKTRAGRSKAKARPAPHLDRRQRQIPRDGEVPGHGQQGGQARAGRRQRHQPPAGKAQR